MNKLSNNTAIIYARVSSKQQDRKGYSIPKQIEICQRYAYENGLEVIATFDEKESAKNTGRVKFGQVLDLISEGRAKHLIVEKDDRLTRNFADKAILDELIKINGLTVHLVRPRKVIDRNSPPEDRLFQNIQTSFAQYYVDDLSQKVKKGQQGALDNGLWPAKNKVGYHRKNGEKVMSPDNVQSEIVKKLFKSAETGLYNLRQLRRLGLSLGLRTCQGSKPTIETVRQILMDTFYYGWIRWGKDKETGQYKFEGPGIHKPIITKALYDRVQKVMRTEPYTSSKPEQFPYKPLLRCEICGCPMTAELKKKTLKTTGQVKEYILYHCTGTREHHKIRSINQNLLEKQFADHIGEINLSEDNAKQLSDFLKKRHNHEEEAQKTLLKNLKGEKTKLENRKNQLLTMRLDGEIDKEQYSYASKQLHTDIQSIEQRIVEIEQNPFLGDHGVEKIIELLNSIENIYHMETRERKAKLLNLLASNWLFDGVSVSPVYRKPLDRFIEADTFQEQWAILDSNQ